MLRQSTVWPVAAASAVTLFSGLYYKHRIGGITGDCFGATSQLTLLAVYLCGVWRG
jgi:adenosylcobinamide-GDP ribazoletransferase